MIADYDPAWPVMAEAAVAELRAAMPSAIEEIEHIGSTAVPGLAAKPVIDLMAAVVIEWGFLCRSLGERGLINLVWLVLIG